MNASASIDHLTEVLADEGLLASQNSSFRDPRSPSFVFFDDDREIDSELKAFRDDLLGFEEWCADNNFTDTSTHEVGMFTVHRDLRPWDPEEPDHGLVRYQERQESRSRANWMVQFHARMMHNPSNDRWHRVLRNLGMKMTDAEDEIFSDPKLKTCHPVVNLRNVVKERVKYAPGPVDGTMFKNPDGSTHKTTGTNPGQAKAAFITRHKLEEEFVSVDRVQYEGQRTSHYVVGQRRASDRTISSYYDPQPAWKDYEGGSYAPRSCALFRVGDSLTMPTGSHRLTVRQFEQAIIAGAECYDNENDALCGSIESDFAAEGAGYFEEDSSDALSSERIYDGRISLHGNMGTTGRPESSFTDEEAFLMGILRMIGDEHGQELMLLQNQEPNALHRHFFSCGSYDGVVSLLQFVAKTEPEMLSFVTDALCGDEALAHHMV